MGGAAIEAAKAWKYVSNFSQEAGKSIGNAAGNTKDWVVKHPGQTVGMVGCVAAAPVAIAVAPLALGAVGFGSGGVVAGTLILALPSLPSSSVTQLELVRLICGTGSAAAAAQASIGNVVAGSTFAVLQSAGAGGAGLAVVNGVVGTAATAVAVGATAPGLVRAAREGKEENEDADSEKEPKDEGHRGPKEEDPEDEDSRQND